jgi:RNA polymerase sigma factor (sigma-70 family)
MLGVQPNHPVPPPKRTDFAGLYLATVAPLRRYLARFLRDSSEAQDVAHDAYLRVYPIIQNDSAEKPEALLYTTARRLAINRLKRQKNAPVATSTDQANRAASLSAGVVQTVQARQELEQLEAAIAELPPGCRAVLLLRKVELLSHQEIADRLGIAISTIEKQHARALRLLRSKMQSTRSSSHHVPEKELGT